MDNKKRNIDFWDSPVGSFCEDYPELSFITFLSLCLSIFVGIITYIFR